MMLVKSGLLATMLAASAANAHMIMSNPVPYSKDSLNNSPLAADGSDFPCKLRADAWEVTTQNIMPIGESQKLAFIGSATHGGGSCQISLTTDLQPTKTSSWKVIKSFEGGCPANDTGNLSGGATMVDPYHFEFAIPEGIETGKYTLAWTWFNRIGNREMYMNCAPVTVTSGSSKRDTEMVEKRSTSFPPMFVANINGCTTTEGIDIRFPDPGDVISYDGAPANLQPKGEAACSGTPTFGGSGDTASGSDASSGSSGPSGSSGSSSAGAAAPSATSSSTPSAASPEPNPPTASEPTSSSASAAPAPSSSDSAGPSSGSGSSSGTLSGSCSSEGEWNCIDGSSFQRCASGQWSAVMPVAPGTECAAGQSTDLSITATKKARSIMRFRKRAATLEYHA
ncbi:CAZyme family AA11 [Penicillium riverlandense]|uniref:CAZyme family AA11 n=1 Tax=Penicillium riverlandense TaxID=1903569 RepID=UPI0025478B4F|nr:CAZyme family AA11 [Penicillium riverlandense]KAJ5832030.1 CAZyme family AA11 [Penicillium riverlandense]